MSNIQLCRKLKTEERLPFGLRYSGTLFARIGYVRRKGVKPRKHLLAISARSRESDRVSKKFRESISGGAEPSRLFNENGKSDICRFIAELRPVRTRGLTFLVPRRL